MLRQNVLIKKKIARKRDRNMQQDATYQSRSNVTLTESLTECNVITNLAATITLIGYIDGGDFVFIKLFLNKRKKNLKKKTTNAEE